MNAKIVIFFLVVLIKNVVCDQVDQKTGCCNRRSITCGPFPTVGNGEFVAISNFLGDQAPLVCFNGFVPTGEVTLTCESNGQWGGYNGETCIAGVTGTAFMTAIPRVTFSSSVASDTEFRRVYITTDSSQGPANVKIFSPNGPFSDNFMVTDFAVRDVPLALTLTESNVERFKGLEITSDKPIYVHTFVHRDGGDELAFESFLNTPVTELSTEYVVVTTRMAPLFFVVAVEDDTNVTITIPSLAPDVRNLDKFEVYTKFVNLIDDGLDNDLTGTTISSTKPVVACSGGYFSSTPLEVVGSRDASYIQLPGVSDLITFGIIAPYLPRPEFEFKLVATQNTTTIGYTIDGNLFTQEVNSGEFIRVYETSGRPVLVEADKPILAVSLSVNEAVGGVPRGDGSMVRCQCPDRFLNKYFFHAPANFMGVASLPPANVANTLRIFVNSSSVSALRLNGNPISAFSSLTIPGANPYTILYVYVTNLVYYVLQTLDGQPFGADIFGTTKFGQFTHQFARSYP